VILDPEGFFIIMPLHHLIPNGRRNPGKVSLARALSKFGYCSRSQAQTIIAEGKVKVNRSLCLDPEYRVDLDREQIEVEGQRLSSIEKIYLMLNKPRGLVTTVSDEKGRETVYSCLRKENFPWLASVGRLDKASEGLLLFTNDSQWAAKILDPQSRLEKAYHVQIDRVADENLIRQIFGGVKAKDGDFLSIKRAKILRRGTRTCWLEIILDEGKNRHIRRLLSALGVEGLRLMRVAIGPLHLGTLSKGAYRRLSKNEIESMGKVKKVL